MWFVKWIRPRAELIDKYDEYEYDDNDDCDDCHCGDCLNDVRKYDMSLEEARQNFDNAVTNFDRIFPQSPRADESATNVDNETMKRPAREECEEDGPSHNDPSGEPGEPGVIDSDIAVENESDTTSLDDFINEVKSF